MTSSPISARLPTLKRSQDQSYSQPQEGGQGDTNTRAVQPACARHAVSARRPLGATTSHGLRSAGALLPFATSIFLVAPSHSVRHGAAATTNRSAAIDAHGLFVERSSIAITGWRSDLAR